MLDQFFNSPWQIGVETLFLLIILIAMEAVLSADNAIALATLSRTLQHPRLEQRALNIGLGLAYIFRILLILGATWVVQFWQFELIGALYLLWLVWQHFSSEKTDNHQSIQARSLWQIIPLIALTDLAFSLDSVTTAIAISQELWLIIVGGTIGVITLRFLAGLFINWLQEFTHLEDAGYLAVALVGLRLLLRVVNPDLVPPEWVIVSLIAAFFVWGFSARRQPPAPITIETTEMGKQSRDVLHKY